jgi:DNA replication protein
MKQFTGFPARMQFTPVPNLFFSNLLPEINDIDELKVTLYIINSIYKKKGYLRFVTYSELLADKSLVSSLKQKEKPAAEVLKEALKQVVKRGTVIQITLAKEGTPGDVYFLNTEADKRAVERIKNRELALTGLMAGGQSNSEIEPGPPPDIFNLYEQNIGLLSPIIADELREAEKIYPEEWIRDAFKEAVSLNKRNWRYIERILENWTSEGKGDGTYRRDNKKSKTKPDKQNGRIFQS